MLYDIYFVVLFFCRISKMSRSLTSNKPIRQPTLWEKINNFKVSREPILLLDNDEDFNDQLEIHSELLKFYRDNLTNRPSEMSQLRGLMIEYGVDPKDYVEEFETKMKYGNYQSFKFIDDVRFINTMTKLKELCHSLVYRPTNRNEEDTIYYGDIFFGYVFEGLVQAVIPNEYKHVSSTTVQPQVLNSNYNSPASEFDLHKIKASVVVNGSFKSIFHEAAYNEFICTKNDSYKHMTTREFIDIISTFDACISIFYGSITLFIQQLTLGVLSALFRLFSRANSRHYNCMFQGSDGRNGKIDIYNPDLIIDIKCTALKPEMFMTEDNINMPYNYILCKEQLKIYAARLGSDVRTYIQLNDNLPSPQVKKPNVIAMLNPICNEVVSWSLM